MMTLDPSMHEKEYQRQIKLKLEEAIAESGLGGYSVRWDPHENRGDLFVLNKSKREILVIEVKKTRLDVSSPRYWDQARKYVLNSRNWDPNAPKIFCVTNGEVLYSFCLRTDFTHIKYCLLKNGVAVNGEFGPAGEADAVLGKFKGSIKPILEIVLGKRQVEFDENWYPILEKFRVEMESISKEIQATTTRLGNKGLEDAIRDLSPHSPIEEARSSIVDQMAATILFKALCYEIIRNYLKFKSLKLVKGIRLNPLKSAGRRDIIDSLTDFYSDILRIDYKQIFQEDRITGDITLSDAAKSSLFSFVSILNAITNAWQEISNTDFLIASMVDALTTQEEKHEHAFAIEDRPMAEQLTRLCVKNHDDKVIDVAAGTCTILDSVYDRLVKLKADTGSDASHGGILKQISAIEGNQFIAKIGMLRLALKNPLEETLMDLKISDTFGLRPQPKWNVVLCNPPYLRHEDIPIDYKEFMKESITQGYKNQKVNGNFPYSSGQADKYFYFLEWGYLYLKDGGTGGFILSDKFLNSKTGGQLKKFLLERTNLKEIVKYPGKHFEGLDVTTCFVIFKKGIPKADNKVRFVKLFEEVTPQRLDELAAVEVDVNTSEAKVVVRDQGSLEHEAKWGKMLLNIPLTYKECYDKSFMKPLKDIFPRHKRGKDNGCNAFFFPTSTIFKKGEGESQHDFEERRKKHKEEIDTTVANLEEKFLKHALNNADVPKNYLLVEEDTKQDLLLVIPPGSALPQNMKKMIDIANTTYRDEKSKMRSVLDGNVGKVSSRPTVDARQPWYSLYDKNQREDDYAIIIPRMHRASFKVLMSNKKVYFSTNFVGFGRLGELSQDDVMFAAGFLMSSLGQLQFEVEGDWREGLLKVEAGPMYELKVPDPAKVPLVKKRAVSEGFKKLKFGLSGLERPSKDNPRFELDKAVMSLFYPEEDCESKALEIVEALFQTVQDRDPENKRR